jgi:fatty acid desaturase
MTEITENRSGVHASGEALPAAGEAGSSDAGSHPGSLASARNDDRARTTRINSAIRAASRDLRARHGFLRHQDGIGLAIQLAAVAVGAAAGLGHVRGVLPAWATILIVALATSIVHEIEHDLIHHLYFKENRATHNLMMALAWLVRPNTINPWLRRGLHINHHRVSGTATDLEERAITNGESFGVKRLVMMADGVAAFVLRLNKAGNRRGMIVGKFLAGYAPLGWVHFGLWYTFLALHAAHFVGGHALPVWTPTLDTTVVVWLAPNVLRSFCLNFVSSNVHYFGDVTSGNVIEQTQVLDDALFLPFQLFCFNFGGTHAIHHFVANEPFYVRQGTAPAALAALRANGVPFNDLGTFRRANRRNERPAKREREVGVVGAVRVVVA